MKIKVIILTEIISPYRIPVFNEIAKNLSEEFLVLFFAESERRRHWNIYREKIKFHYEVLPSTLFQIGDSEPYFFNPTVVYRLIKYSPEILILGGYHQLSCLLALLYARFFKKKAILWCESNKYELRYNNFLKEIYKRWFVRNCSGFIVPGKASFEYLMSLGAETKKIWVAVNSVDNDYFSQTCYKHRQIRDIFKQSKGYPKNLILYVGQLIKEKGIFDLLKAFQMLSQEQSDLGLLFIGSGAEEKRLRQFCRKNNIRNVFFEGFVQQEDLPAYYVASDIFILPTFSDAWGLVLDEAMACGLPVISSDAAGAAYDLIVNGENGYIFKKGNTEELAGCIKDILNNEKKKETMMQKSLSIIKDYSPVKCAEGFIRAIREV